jgi:predicted ABC-type ATPase
MPNIIIIAGPNGAGKSTFIRVQLPSTQMQNFIRLDADEIEKQLDPAIVGYERRSLAAGRILLERLQDVVDARGNVLLETTLTLRGYAQRIPTWKQAGYSVALIYLRLPTVEMSIERVRRRVEAGGHDIPEATIRRRFGKSLRYLDELYKPIVDEWYVWRTDGGEPVPESAWDIP